MEPETVDKLADDVEKLLKVAEAAEALLKADCGAEPFAKARLQTALRKLHERS